MSLTVSLHMQFFKLDICEKSLLQTLHLWLFISMNWNVYVELRQL